MVLLKMEELPVHTLALHICPVIFTGPQDAPAPHLQMPSSAVSMHVSSPSHVTLAHGPIPK